MMVDFNKIPADVSVCMWISIRFSVSVCVEVGEEDNMGMC
jgi:hypothetical protein